LIATLATPVYSRIVKNYTKSYDSLCIVYGNFGDAEIMSPKGGYIDKDYLDMQDNIAMIEEEARECSGEIA
jgi:hypothetical protein